MMGGVAGNRRPYQDRPGGVCTLWKDRYPVDSCLKMRYSSVMSDYAAYKEICCVLWGDGTARQRDLGVALFFLFPKVS